MTHELNPASPPFTLSIELRRVRRRRLLNVQHSNKCICGVYHARCGHTRFSRRRCRLPKSDGASSPTHPRKSLLDQHTCSFFTPTMSRAPATVASLPPRSSCLLTPALCPVSPARQNTRQATHVNINRCKSPTHKQQLRYYY